MQENTQNILFYKTKEWNIALNVFFENETLWASQKQIAEIFWVSTQNITMHIKNIYDEWELTEKWTCKEFLQVQKEGKRKVSREINFYSLDIILSVWYRVNSYKATQFRIWANSILKEYIIKGFAMDDERLKNWEQFGKDYFEELLARIREIRSSERRFYQKVTDIYAMSVDYDPKSKISTDFFAKVQNTFLYAICDKTAGEVIYSRANANVENMWLTTWSNQKNGWKILSTDTEIWKNYLSEQEISNLNLLISGYLDFAELQARKWKIMTMQNWIDKTSSFLELNDMKILEWKGKISHTKALEKAKKEFEVFRVTQDKTFKSDFDTFAESIQSKTIL